MKRPYTCEICQIAQSEGNLMYQVIKALTKEISAGFPSRGWHNKLGSRSKAGFSYQFLAFNGGENIKRKVHIHVNPERCFSFPPEKNFPVKHGFLSPGSVKD